MPYNQFKAMLAITRASLKSIFRSPSAVVFSLAFPFIFILVFGFLGDGNRSPSYRIAIAADCDTSNVLFDSIKASSNIRIKYFSDTAALQSDLRKGRLAGVLHIRKTGLTAPAFTYRITSTTASGDQFPALFQVLSNISNQLSNVQYANRPVYAIHDFNQQRDIAVIREYHTIDFILPGQIGFSLLSSGVFGVAFSFFGLRNMLVLKRFFATPISRTFIILGEGLSRVIFNMTTAIVIILVGYFFFNFTLINGFATLIDLLVLSFVGLLVFMGFGFIVSGVAKTDSTIPPFANMITLPQFLLGGTFFSVEAFPKWLQPISKALPLTHLNTAMRAVAFEGQNLWQVRGEIGYLLVCGLVVYLVAIKLFKWE